MGLITQLTEWIDEQVLTHTALNAEFAQLINAINALVNENWAAAGVGNLDGQKVDVHTNAQFLAEHSAGGGHQAFANVNVDMGRIYRNAGTPDSKVDIKYNRITVYNSGTITTRLRKLLQAAAATTLTADIAAANGANALDTGAAAASTGYFIWVIYKSSTETVASLLSLAATIGGLTLPADYDYALLMGKVWTDGDSDFLAPRPIPGVGIETTAPVFENAKDMSANGYMHFGNGLILQWGFEGVPGDSDEVITLPLEYPNSPLAAVASQGGGFATDTDAGAGCHTFTTTQLTLRNGAPTEQIIRWFSIGY